MHRAFNKALRVGAAVVLISFVCVVLFSMLVSCSAFKEDKVLEIDCSMECKDCTELKMHCGSDMGLATEGEDAISRDLGMKARIGQEEMSESNGLRRSL